MNAHAFPMCNIAGSDGNSLQINESVYVRLWKSRMWERGTRRNFRKDVSNSINSILSHSVQNGGNRITKCHINEQLYPALPLRWAKNIFYSRWWAHLISPSAFAAYRSCSARCGIYVQLKIHWYLCVTHMNVNRATVAIPLAMIGSA